MAVIELAITKNWYTGTTVVETNWDRIRNPVVQWSYYTNRNLEQLAKDIAGSSYSLDNDGGPNLSTNLQQQITNILAGATAITGTTSDTFEVNTDGNSVIISSSGLTGDRTITFPDANAVMVGTTTVQDITNKSSVLIGRPSANAISATPLDVLSTTSFLATFESTSAGADGPEIQMFHNSASPAANDNITALESWGKNSSATTKLYTNIVSQISDPTNGSEDANILFKTIVAGSFGTRGGFFGTDFYIGRSSANAISATPLDVLSTSFPLAMFESTSAGPTGPSLYFFHNSASPAANDQISTFKFYGKDSGSGTTEYAQIGVSISDTTAASEDASIFFQTKVAGSLATRGGFFGDALFVGRTSANAITPTALDVFTQNNEVAMFENNISGTGGPAILTYHNSASPAVSDFLGSYQFYGNSDSGVKRKYVSIASQILDPTNTSEDSQIIFQTIAAGTIATRFTVGNTFVSTTTDFIIPTTNKLSLNAGGTSYISETSSDVLQFYAGGLSGIKFNPTGGGAGSMKLGDGFTTMPTDLNGNLRPYTDDTYNLGQSTSDGSLSNVRWKYVNCMALITANGAQWDLQGFTAGADVASNGYVTVVINGTSRKLMTTA